MSAFGVIKFIWKAINLIREVFLNLIFLLIILLIFSGYYLIKDSQTKEAVVQKGALVFDLQGIIVDSNQDNQDIYQLRSKLYGKKADTSRENSLFELTKKIEQAKNDPNISCLLLKLDNFVGADLSSLQYIGKYLTQFRQSNKPIYAIGSHFNQSQYYLASFANNIDLTPQGSVSVYGMSASNLYYRKLLDNLKVNTHVFRVGTYKSAVEPLIRDDMSQQAKENTTRWLSGMWKNYLSDIADNRSRAPEQLVPNADVMLTNLKQANGSMTEYALSTGLVDKIIPFYQFENEFEKQPEVSIYDYKLASAENSTATEKPSIAVVFINGTIALGENSNNVAGSDDIVEQLKKIRQNLNVQAVVLRVNSPGGSVEASEAIRNELEAIRENHIPVIVSMGGMAASGGYWISTASDYIVASPNTITGSIGIFGVVPTFENTLAQVGVYSDGITTSPLAKSSITDKLPDEMNQLIQMNIESGYHTFISLVANARNMSLKDVDKIGQGQVWLGQEAQKIGLVDKLGDFDDAIEMAATLANLTDYSIDWQQQESAWYNALFSNIMTILPKSTAEIIFNQLPQAKQLKQQLSILNQLNDSQNRYVYCLNCADIR